MSDYFQCCDTTVAMQCYTICCVDYFIHTVRKREVTTFLFYWKSMNFRLKWNEKFCKFFHLQVMKLREKKKEKRDHLRLGTLHLGTKGLKPFNGFSNPILNIHGIFPRGFELWKVTEVWEGRAWLEEGQVSLRGVCVHAIKPRSFLCWETGRPSPPKVISLIKSVRALKSPRPG